MSVLRVSESDLDVDELLAHVKIRPCSIFRKGQKRIGYKSQISEKSGFNLSMSDADFTNLPAQIKDTIAFILEHQDDLSFIMSFPGVTAAELDFGIARRDVFVQNDSFPAELLLLVGNLGIGITLSQYPICDESLASNDKHLTT